MSDPEVIAASGYGVDIIEATRVYLATLLRGPAAVRRSPEPLRKTSIHPSAAYEAVPPRPTSRSVELRVLQVPVSFREAPRVDVAAVMTTPTLPPVAPQPARRGERADASAQPRA